MACNPYRMGAPFATLSGIRGECSYRRIRTEKSGCERNRLTHPLKLEGETKGIGGSRSGSGGRKEARDIEIWTWRHHWLHEQIETLAEQGREYYRPVLPKLVGEDTISLAWHVPKCSFLWTILATCALCSSLAAYMVLVARLASTIEHIRTSFSTTETTRGITDFGT